jgi:HNH endonuclease
MIERFARFVDVRGLNECWPWTGCKSVWGYGRFAVGNTQKYAPRMMWFFENGKIPDAMSVLHHCDNPACVNPNHLYLGTQRQNMLDAYARKRKKPVCFQGADNPSAKLSDLEVEAARKMNDEGWSHGEIAKQFGLNRQTISNVCNYRSFTH